MTNPFLQCLAAAEEARRTHQAREAAATRDHFAQHPECRKLISAMDREGHVTRVKGEIDIEVEVTDGNLDLIYKDNGVGVPESELRKIFEPFYTTRRGQGGSGLGLSVVYNLVTQKLGGTIDVQAQPGLQFRIRLASHIDMTGGRRSEMIH